MYHKRLDRGRQSNHCALIKQNGKQMWASVTSIWTRQKNPRTKIQASRQLQISKFAWNWTRESITTWLNRMVASKCEHAWQSSKQEKPIHIPSHSWANDQSSPSSPSLVGIEPVSWLEFVQTEWQRNVSKRDICANKTNQSTYGATDQPTM